MERNKEENGMQNQMTQKNISIMVLGTILALAMIGCANQSIYPSQSPSSNDWRLWTGVALAIQLGIAIFGLVIMGDEETRLAFFAAIIGASIITFASGYLIIGEWGLRLNMWALGSTIGTVILIILSLVGGFFGSVRASIGIWVLNSFFWHSTEVSKYLILPTIIGTTIAMIVGALAVSKIKGDE